MQSSSMHVVAVTQGGLSKLVAKLQQLGFRVEVTDHSAFKVALESAAAAQGLIEAYLEKIGQAAPAQLQSVFAASCTIRTLIEQANGNANPGWATPADMQRGLMTPLQTIRATIQREMANGVLSRDGTFAAQFQTTRDAVEAGLKTIVAKRASQPVASTQVAQPGVVVQFQTITVSGLSPADAIEFARRVQAPSAVVPSTTSAGRVQTIVSFDGLEHGEFSLSVRSNQGAAEFLNANCGGVLRAVGETMTQRAQEITNQLAMIGGSEAEISFDVDSGLRVVIGGRQNVSQYRPDQISALGQAIIVKAKEQSDAGQYAEAPQTAEFSVAAHRDGSSPALRPATAVVNA